MADFVFYVDKAGRDLILHDLLEGRQLSLTPNLNYSTPHPKPFESVTDELLDCLEINPVCYISGPFSTQAIQTTKMEKGRCAGTYVVTAERCGSVLKLSLVAKRIGNDSPYLAPSHLTYARGIGASEDLKAAFKLVRRLVTGRCQKLRSPLSLWVGKSASKSFEAGELSLLVDGRCIARHGTDCVVSGKTDSFSRFPLVEGTRSITNEDVARLQDEP